MDYKWVKLSYFAIYKTLVIESEDLSIAEVAETIADNFANVDDIIDQESRTIPDKAMENISKELNDPSKIEEDTEIEDDSSTESSTSLSTTASTEAGNDGLDTREILLISFGSFFEALFIGITIYFFIMDKKTSGLIGCAVSVLIRKLALPRSFVSLWLFSNFNCHRLFLAWKRNIQWGRNRTNGIQCASCDDFRSNDNYSPCQMLQTYCENFFTKKSNWNDKFKLYEYS